MKEGGCLDFLSGSQYFFFFFQRSFVSTPGIVNEHLIGVKEEPDVCLSSYPCNSLFPSPSLPIWMLCNPLALSITTRLLVILHSVNHQQLQIEENESTGNRNTYHGHSFLWEYLWKCRLWFLKWEEFSCFGFLTLVRQNKQCADIAYGHWMLKMGILV